MHSACTEILIGSAHLLQALLQTEGVTYHVLRVDTYAHAL
jgi:hypothetical protein